jgi:hypothetical protein
MGGAHIFFVTGPVRGFYREKRVDRVFDGRGVYPIRRIGKTWFNFGDAQNPYGIRLK